MQKLPIDSIVSDLLGHLTSTQQFIIAAPPGAGKSTRIPLVLLKAPEFLGKKILLLEPRRIAARSIAGFIAEEMGEKVGNTVGYRIRGETRVSAGTRLEVITEGVLSRMLLQDPELSGVGAIIFDEFHERSVHADLGLALCLDVQETLRPDLSLFIMSATLDLPRLQSILPAAKTFSASGRSYPVDVRYRPKRKDQTLVLALDAVLREALRDNHGDILVFLPGRAEIERCLKQFHALSKDNASQLLPLHSGVSLDAQALVLARNTKRKIILATSIAETSLTIEGVTVVIDSGLSRLEYFDLGRGMNQLVTESVSQAQADQRAGRAGRTQAGVCYRVWDESQYLIPHSTPEIVRTDCSAFLLSVRAWGVSHLENFRLLDYPSESSLKVAEEFLKAIAALDRQGAITLHGREVLRLGLSPRIGHMLILGKREGLTLLAVQCALMLEDTGRRLKTLELPHPSDFMRELSADERRRFEREVSHLLSLLDSNEVDEERETAESLELLAMIAFPERIAKRREGSENQYVLRSGGGAELARFSERQQRAPEFLVAVKLEGSLPHARIVTMLPLSQGLIEKFYALMIEKDVELSWDLERGNARVRELRRLGSLVIWETWRSPSKAEWHAALKLELFEQGISLLPLSERAENFLCRLAVLRQAQANHACALRFTPEILLNEVDEWLFPYLLVEPQPIAQLKEPISKALLARCTYSEQKEFDALLPEVLRLPSGRELKIDYAREGGPTVSAKLQDFFGLRDTPQLAGGLLPLRIELLSPARRPLQITTDLQGFWRGSYKEVRKEMQGRYPKHFWPEDPVFYTQSQQGKK